MLSGLNGSSAPGIKFLLIKTTFKFLKNQISISNNENVEGVFLFFNLAILTTTREWL